MMIIAKFISITDRIHDEKGFTLIELIVSLVLLAILGTVFGMGIVGAMNIYAVSEENVQLAQKGQMAMIRIERELMELTTVFQRNDSDPYIIYGNLRGSGIHAIRFDAIEQRVLLYSDLGSLTAPLNDEDADVLVDRVADFSLSYWQGGSPWTDNDQRHLSHIQTHLELSRPSGLIPTNPEFDGRVYLRNTINYGGAAPATEPPEPPTMGSYGCFIGTSAQGVGLGVKAVLLNSTEKLYKYWMPDQVRHDTVPVAEAVIPAKAGIQAPKPSLYLRPIFSLLVIGLLLTTLFIHIFLAKSRRTDLQPHNCAGHRNHVTGSALIAVIAANPDLFHHCRHPATPGEFLGTAVRCPGLCRESLSHGRVGVSLCRIGLSEGGLRGRIGWINWMNCTAPTIRRIKATSVLRFTVISIVSRHPLLQAQRTN